jgi:hypothetical protein
MTRVRIDVRKQEACEVCGYASSLEVIPVHHRRTGEAGVLRLCGNCLTKPDRAWRMTWRPVGTQARIEGQR